MPKVVVGERRIPAPGASAQLAMGLLVIPLVRCFKLSSPGVARDRRPVLPRVVSEVVATAEREGELLVVDRERKAALVAVGAAHGLTQEEAGPS